jgi:hypothetical protein
VRATPPWFVLLLLHSRLGVGGSVNEQYVGGYCLMFIFVGVICNVICRVIKC